MLETNKSFMFSSSAPPSRPVDHLTSQKPLLQSRSYYRPSFQQEEEGSSSSSYARHDMLRHPEEPQQQLYKLHHNNNNLHSHNSNNNSVIKHSYNNRPVYPSGTTASATTTTTSTATTTATATTTTTTTTTTTAAAAKSTALYMDYEEKQQTEWYEPPSGSSSSFYEFTDSGDQKARKQRELSSRIKKLNSDFLENKERIYSEKSISIDKELKDAKTESHTFYLDSLRELEVQRQKMIEKSRLFREYQEQVTDNQFRLEIYQAEEEYMTETQDIRDKLFATLEEKRRKLKEDKDNCDLAYDVVLESQSRLHKRNLRKRVPENTENKLGKRKQTSPAFVFRLKDEEIQSDFQAMQSVKAKK